MYGAYLEEDSKSDDYDYDSKSDDYDYDMLEDYDDMLEQDAYLTQKKKKDDESIDSDDLMDLIEMLEDSDDQLTNKKAYLNKQKKEEKDSEDDAQDLLEDYDAYLQEHPDDVQGTWDYTYELKTYETVAPVASVPETWKYTYEPKTWEYTYEPKTWDYTYEPKTWEYTYEPNTYETVAPVAGKDMHPYTNNMAYLKKGDRKHSKVETRHYTHAPVASVQGTWDYTYEPKTYETVAPVASVPETWEYTYEPNTWKYTYEPKTWDYTYEPKTWETVAPVADKDMHPYPTNMAYLKKDDRKHVETRDYTYAPLASVPGTWEYTYEPKTYETVAPVASVPE